MYSNFPFHSNFLYISGLTVSCIKLLLSHLPSYLVTYSLSELPLRWLSSPNSPRRNNHFTQQKGGENVNWNATRNQVCLTRLLAPPQSQIRHPPATCTVYTTTGSDHTSPATCTPPQSQITHPQQPVRKFKLQSLYAASNQLTQMSKTTKKRNEPLLFYCQQLKSINRSQLREVPTNRMKLFIH